jgi:hypothetical protein
MLAPGHRTPQLSQLLRLLQPTGGGAGTSVCPQAEDWEHEEYNADDDIDMGAEDDDGASPVPKRCVSI